MACGIDESIPGRGPGSRTGGAAEGRFCFACFLQLLALIMMKRGAGARGALIDAFAAPCIVLRLCCAVRRRWGGTCCRVQLEGSALAVNRSPC